MEGKDLSRPRGTRDFPPPEMAMRRSVEARMREIFHRHGYGEIQTPTFEHADLFIARSGPQILEQVYEFEDKSKRHMVLRPELTAPTMRFYSTDLKNEPKPLRLYYFGNCFRYERPQAGRYREFWQMGLEYIGKRTSLANAEVVSTAIEAMISSGVLDFRVRIGHVKLLGSILKRYGIDPAVDKNAMIAIDKKDREAIERILSGTDRVEMDIFIDILTKPQVPREAETTLSQIAFDDPGLQPCCDEVKNLLSLLSGLKAQIYFDPSISRGLDYYDGMVFEIDIPSLGAEKQVCGGGAYSLSSMFGGEVEGIGFAIGFDRVMVALKGEGPTKEQVGGIYIIPMGDEANGSAFRLQRELIERGHLCVLETQGRNLKKSLSAASSLGSRHAIIIGSEELKNDQATLKDLLTGEQEKVAMGSVHERITRKV